ncbi:GMP synthase [Marinomonas sp. 42_23_T18]|nr:GMP synthase [Marinomonas sp. 42_23_T18]
MKIGLLQCDSVMDSLQGEHGNYPAMFRDLFKSVDDSIELSIFDVREGQYPDDIHAFDGFVTTGSRHGAEDDLPWITELIGFVQKLYQEKVKLVGICFGHQIIAKALGGQVVKSDKGWGVGVSVNEVVDDSAQKLTWMQPHKAEMKLIVSHQDQVVQLPEGSQVLAASDFCPAYMYQVGECFLSVQGHPEFSKAYSNDLMESRRDRISHDVIEAGQASLEQDVDDELMTRWIINFLKA